MEEGTVTPQIMNNIKYVMDGVIEFEEKDNKRCVRVASMKWTKSNSSWVNLPN
jgi:KaiC/GvpD/RAD55 family RecA-like ATPase